MAVTEKITLEEMILNVEKAAEKDQEADRLMFKALRGVGRHTIHTGKFIGIGMLIDCHQKAIDNKNLAAAKRFGRALELLNIGLFHKAETETKGKGNRAHTVYTFTPNCKDIAERSVLFYGLPQDKTQRKAARKALTENWQAFEEMIEIIEADLWTLKNVKIRYNTKRTRTLTERGKLLAEQLKRYLELSEMNILEFAAAYGIDIPVEEEEAKEEKAAAA